MKEITVSPKEDINEVIRTADPHTRIMLSEGVYRQKLEISVPYIELVGAGTDKTVIVYDDYANKIHDDGKEYNTFRTYTFAVLAPHVSLKNLTVENDSLKPEEKGQEVALTVYADDFHAEDCSFISTQDTIFCGPLPPDLIKRYDGFLKDELRTEGYSRQIYKNCFIAGTVDFIFGCGDALFENCDIKSLYDVRGHGYAAAPAHALEQEIGFVFDDCTMKYAEGDIVIIPPAIPHTNNSEQGFTNIHINITDATLPFKVPIVISDDSDNHILSSFNDAFYYFNSKINNHQLIIAAFGNLIVNYVIAFQSTKPLRNVIGAIKSNIMQNFTDCDYELDTYLKTIPFSYDYLRKLFKSEMGMTPHNYLVSLRMQMAEKLLCSTNGDEQNISQIAYVCGFAEPLYFSRVFKKNFGCSPKNYAAKMQQKKTD